MRSMRGHVASSCASLRERSGLSRNAQGRAVVGMPTATPLNRCRSDCHRRTMVRNSSTPTPAFQVTSTRFLSRAKTMTDLVNKSKQSSRAGIRVRRNVAQVADFSTSNLSRRRRRRDGRMKCAMCRAMGREACDDSTTRHLRASSRPSDQDLCTAMMRRDNVSAVHIVARRNKPGE